MVIIINNVKTIHIDKIQKNARIYIQELKTEGKNKKWLALLPVDYYGEEAFLYQKDETGYLVTGNAFIVNKTKLKEKRDIVYKDLRYAYIQTIYV